MIPNMAVVTNGKGGVGKTTLAANLAGLSAQTWRTLLIDLDPQSNLNEDLGLDRSALDDGNGLLASVLTDGTKPSIVKQVRQNLDFIASGSRTQTLRDMFTMNREPDELVKFRNAIATVANDYDLIVVDTPPATDRLVEAAFMAAHFLILPTKGDKSSVRGLVPTAELFARMHKESLNPYIKVLGICRFGINHAHRRRIKNVSGRISDTLDNVPVKVFDTVIREANLASEAARDKGVLIHEYAIAAEEAPAFWESLKNGTPAPGFASNAGPLATDYLNLWNEVRQAYTSELTLWIEEQNGK